MVEAGRIVDRRIIGADTSVGPGFIACNPAAQGIATNPDLPGSPRTVMFEAHQDTVPTDHMTVEPFRPHVEDGRLYGRGSCDIKGGMAAMLAAFARLARERPKGAASVVMACSVDEEYTFT